jgi:hypothetical protein
MGEPILRDEKSGKNVRVMYFKKASFSEPRTSVADSVDCRHFQAKPTQFKCHCNFMEMLHTLLSCRYL